MKKTEYEKHCTFMRESVTLDDYPKIEGWDFEKTFDLQKFLEQYAQTGFQGANLGYAIKVVNKMIADDAKIVLSFTGNTISSGLREIITYLVKNKKVHAIVTSAAGIEEDIVKTCKPFVVGDFDIPGNVLFEKGVGRIGNIFAPFDRYLYFEEKIDPFLEKVYKEQQKKKRPLTATEFTKLLGKNTKDTSSYLYWAAKHDIPVYCPALQDGAIGDLFYFFKNKKKDFAIDCVGDSKKMIDFLINEENVGTIILGGGVAKHFTLNSAILREGFDYAVYLTTAEEFDGSDSGGNQEEAKTWAKIKVNAPSVKVKADFTLTFPLLVAGTFYACSTKA